MKDGKRDSISARYERALAAVSLRMDESATNIQSTAESLRRTSLTTGQESHLSALLVGAGELASIAEHLREYAALHFGTRELADRDFDLIEVVEELNDPLAVEAQTKGLAYVSNIGPTVPTLLRGDPWRLRRILTLLLENAVTFTDQGEVCLKIESDEADEEAVTLTITVLDTGRGIATEHRKHLMKPFWQADPGSGQGCGIGLATTALMLKQWDSRLEVYSQPDSGSTFRFRLRIALQADRSTAPSPVDLTGKRILVADANATQRFALQALLQEWGAHCDLAATTAEVRHLARLANDEQLWDLLLVDPDSLELSPGDWSREFAGDTALAGAPGLFLQPLATLSETARDAESASPAHLYKPVRREHLCRAVARALRLPVHESGAEHEVDRAAVVATAPARAVAADSAADAPTGPLILLAEDNRVNRKVAVTMLNAAGYRVETATNGQEAIEALANCRYDLILMDVGMPVMDGLQATRNIRDGWHGAGNEGIPIVAMTAHAMKGDRERCLASGMDDYVAKPVQPEELCTVIERCLTAANGRPPVADIDGVVESSPLLDEAALIARFDGDEKQAQASLVCLLEEAPRLLRDIREALRERDCDRLSAHADQLEEAASLCAASALHDLAVGIGARATQEKIGEVDALVQEAEIVFVRLKHLLARSPVAT